MQAPCPALEEDKGEDARSASVQANYHICFNRFCLLAGGHPRSFSASARGEQPRPLPPPDAASAVAAVAVSRPPCCQPQARSPAKPRWKETAVGVIRKSCQKRSESAQLISAVKTDTGGALLDCTHFFLLQQIPGFTGDQRWNRFWENACETILHSG